MPSLCFRVSCLSFPKEKNQREVSGKEGEVTKNGWEVSGNEGEALGNERGVTRKQRAEAGKGST
jgi:hypothetical protein